VKLLILGLSITSSWGNGHATTYRSLCRALYERGHVIDFFEKDVPWYRNNRDLPQPAYCTVHLYEEWPEARDRIAASAKDADAVVIGSYFADAIPAADALFHRSSSPVLFYDIDTPVTIAALRRSGSCEYLRADQIPQYHAYLSFTGGPTLQELANVFKARVAVPFYCSVDPEAYRSLTPSPEFNCDLAYLGTYAADRQPKLLELLDTPARSLPRQRFIVAGPQYPMFDWQPNVRRIEHVAPGLHPGFYSSARYTLNLTRADMIAAGYSPSVRLFEAAACGAAIISDAWKGLGDFFTSGSEILIAENSQSVIDILTGLSNEERRKIGHNARLRVLAGHTAHHRAIEFERIVETLAGSTPFEQAMLTPVHP